MSLNTHFPVLVCPTCVLYVCMCVCACVCIPVYLCVQPSEADTYSDLEAVVATLESKYSVLPEDIVLYGQSVGSGPTVDLASRLPRLRGVVLHSPIMSGVRVLYEVKTTYWFDIFPVSHTARGLYVPLFPSSPLTVARPGAILLCTPTAKLAGHTVAKLPLLPVLPWYSSSAPMCCTTCCTSYLAMQSVRLNLVTA